MRRALLAAGYLATLAALSALSALAHAPTTHGRAAVRDLANALLASSLRGRLSIASVDALGPSVGVRASGIALRDPEGRPVAEGGALEIPSLSALFRALLLGPSGTLPPITLRVRTVTLRFDDTPTPTIAAALALREAPSRPGTPAQTPRPPRPLQFPSLRLFVERLVVPLEHTPLSLDRIQLSAAMRTEPLALDARLADTTLDAGRFGQATANGSLGLTLPPWSPTPLRSTGFDGSLRAQASLRGAELRCDVSLALDRDGPRVDARECSLGRALLTRALGVPIATDLVVDRLRVGQGSAGSTRVEGALSLGERPIAVALELHGSHLEASIDLDRFDLRSIREDLPASALSGRVRFERDGAALRVDTRGLHALVAGVVVPAATATATLVDGRLTVTSLEVPSLGLRGRGDVDLRGPDHDADAQLEGSVEELSRVETLSGLGLHGSTRFQVSVARRGGRVEIRYDASGRSLGLPGVVRVASTATRGALTIEPDGAIALDASNDVRGLTARGFGPLDATVSVTGDPRRALRAAVRIDGDRITILPGSPGAGPTRIEGVATMVRGPEGMRIALRQGRFSLRGARASLTASATIPTVGRPTVEATVDSLGQGRAHVGAAPDGTLTAEIDGLSGQWLAGALGVRAGDAGTLTGRVSLRDGRPRGALVWRDATIPVLGPVELRLDARPDGRLDALSATLTYRHPPSAPRGVTLGARIDGRAARRGGLQGLLSAIHGVEIDALGVEPWLLQRITPRGLSLDGSADLRLRATRASPSAPLELVVGFDARDVQALADLQTVLPGVLRSVARSARTPLTIPLRARGALCATVAHARGVPEHVVTTLAWGRDDRGPRVPLPTACSLDATRFDGALMSARAESVGPWHDALTGALRTLRDQRTPWREVNFDRPTLAAMSAASVDVDLHVGPASPAQWPFTPTAGRWIPALLRPPVEGTLEASAHVQGRVRAPRLTVDLHAHRDRPTWLGPTDRAGFDATVRIETGRSEGTLLELAAVDVNARGTIERVDRGDAESAPHATAELRATLNPRAWLDGAPLLRALNIERASLRSDPLELSRFAWARAKRVDGQMSLSLSDTGAENQPFVLNGAVDALTIRNQPASNLVLRSVLVNECSLRNPSSLTNRSPERLFRCEGVQWNLRSCAAWFRATHGVAGCDPIETTEFMLDGGLRVLLKVPLEGDWRALRPRTNEIQLDGGMLNFPLERISPIAEVPPISHLAGAVSGTVGWSAQSPRAFRGYVNLHGGELTLEQVGVPLREIDLTLIAQGPRLLFVPPMRMTLGVGAAQGSVSASGLIDLTGAQGELARLRLLPEVVRLPVVQQGELFAILTGAVDLEARLFPDRIVGRLDIQQANVQIPEESARSLQPLDEADGVFVLGRTRAAVPSASRGIVTDITFSSSNPIFVRRRDLLLGISAEGGLRYDRALYLRGTVAQVGRQNFFELFGKRFFFDRTSLLFDGGAAIDPVIDVALHYDSPSDGRIEVTVSGRRSAPVIHFSAERFPGASEAEILAMLVLGRRESRGASDQATLEQQGREAAASLLTAVLYGFGSGQAQRALEGAGLGFVPTVVAEPGADGSALSRLGVGVLPSFLGNRVYLEGTYNNSQATGQGYQFLIDATLSDHFSLGGVVSGSSSHGQRFGVDFFYAP
jgi:hypothetical protein